MAERGRRRRAVFLTQTFPRTPDDTAGPFIREIGAGLARAGWQVRVLAPHARELPRHWRDGPLDVRTFRYAPEALEAIGYSRSLERDESLRAAAALAAPLYLLAARRALRALLREEPAEVVHTHWIVPNGLAAPGGGRPRAGGRTVVGYGLHGSDVFLAERPLVRALVARLLRRGAFLTGCSPELVARVARLSDAPCPQAVIPYGVDAETFRPDPAASAAWRRELGLPEGAVVALGVGRMATKKGFHVLVAELQRLFERAPETLHLVLAGGGDREAELRRASAGWQHRVHFPGLVRRDVLPGLFAAADLFVLPAVHDEKGNVDGLPNVILEAMASALPVVASEISGIPLAVEDGTTGILTREGDGAEVVDAIVRLAAAPEIRRQMGEAGRSKVRHELTWDRVAQRYAEVYEAALERLGNETGAATVEE